MSPPSTIVLITGANSGIGYAASKVIASASRSYHVIMASRSPENGKAALAEIQASAGVKGTLSSLQLDVTDEHSIAAAAHNVASEFNHLDVLINNAGVASHDPNLKKQFEANLTTNVIGPTLVTDAFEPLLLKSHTPYLLNVSSGLGSLAQAADPNDATYKVPYPAYRASKAALNMLTIEDSKRLGGGGGGKQRVKVFAVCPGLVRSNLRGKAEEQVSAGGLAGDPTVSGQLILDLIEGKRDADVGKFVHKDGVHRW